MDGSLTLGASGCVPAVQTAVLCVCTSCSLPLWGLTTYWVTGPLLLTWCVLAPAVYPDGRVCISILHAPGDDPMGYESSAERWSPVQSVEKILLSVVSMLAGEESLGHCGLAASRGSQIAQWRCLLPHFILYFLIQLYCFR